jgi:hypothetical protein
MEKMETSYKYSIYQFPNQKVSTDRLTLEINNSVITISLSRIDTYNDIIDIIFKSELSVDDKNILDSIVANHSGEPIISDTIQQVKIAVEQPWYIEEGNTTQELFCAESLIIDISANETEKIFEFSWPFDIGLKSGTIYVSEDMLGDEMSVKIAPNTIIGVVTQNVNVGDTSAFVSPTVIQNIKYGQFVGFPSKEYEIGRVTKVGPDYLEFENPSDVSVNAGDYIGMCMKIIPYIYFNSTHPIEIGKTIPTSNRIPKDIIVQIVYKNNNNTAKKVSFLIEYLY